MRIQSVVKFVVAVVGFAGGLSCAPDSSSPTAPSERTPTSSASRLVTPVTIAPLERTTPLAKPETASARIGILGGTLSLPGAGLTIVVPPLAVVTPVTIAVVAPAGSDVGYEFSPHGLTFLAPLVATQDLRNTQAQSGGSIDPLLLFLGYFPDSSHPTTVTELLSLQVNLLAQTSTALVWHFSGYMWSSGLADDSAGDGGSQSRRARAAELR
ncbi:MAG: hypothetical protein ACREPM_21440 [Gemmatimonadaceae bacterium]